MSKTKGRVEVPKNIEELLTLAAKVYKKHLDDAAESKLKMLEDYNWSEKDDPCTPSYYISHNGQVKTTVMASNIGIIAKDDASS